MGQVALGFRSLLIKAAVFFVMAALLAWALGGTLWPRAEIVDREPISFAGQDWFWRLAAGGREKGSMRWTLMIDDGSGEVVPADERIWLEVVGPVAAQGGLYYGGRPLPGASADEKPAWRLVWLNDDPKTTDDFTTTVHWLSDRLAVERQLARVRRGLPIQNVDVIDQQRPFVLDPPDDLPPEDGGD